VGFLHSAIADCAVDANDISAVESQRLLPGEKVLSGPADREKRG
jgi:hypothetical protein